MKKKISGHPPPSNSDGGAANSDGHLRVAGPIAFQNTKHCANNASMSNDVNRPPLPEGHRAHC